MCRAEGNKGEKKWDNCNSIINKIFFKKTYDTTLAGVPQWIECQAVNQKVSDSIPVKVHAWVAARSPVGDVQEATMNRSLPLKINK